MKERIDTRIKTNQERCTVKTGLLVIHCWLTNMHNEKERRAYKRMNAWRRSKVERVRQLYFG